MHSEGAQLKADDVTGVLNDAYNNSDLNQDLYASFSNDYLSLLGVQLEEHAEAQAERARLEEERAQETLRNLKRLMIIRSGQVDECLKEPEWEEIDLS
jgi:hypothetical protein